MGNGRGKTKRKKIKEISFFHFVVCVQCYTLHLFKVGRKIKEKNQNSLFNLNMKIH